MKNVASLLLGGIIFLTGITCIMIGLLVIIKDRLSKRKEMILRRITIVEGEVGAISVTQIDIIKLHFLRVVETILQALSHLLEKIEKILEKFPKKERTPIFLIIIGILMCIIGYWIITKG